MAITLYKLAHGKKKMRIVWNEEADRAFEKLRKQELFAEIFSE